MTDLTRTLDALEFAHGFFEARAQMATPGSEGAGKLYECAKGCADAIALLKTQEPTEWSINRLADKIYCPKCGISWNLYIYEQNVKRWAYCPKCGSAKTGVKEV